MAKIKVSDYIASFIKKLGVRYVFVVSGGSNLLLLDSIANKKSLNYICNHHEQASAIAAESYGRAGENIGVCIVTTGPGGTNTITGVAGAWLDSIPVLYISGQVKREFVVNDSELRQVGVQGINIVDIVKPITKYAVTIMNPKEIKYHLQKAVFLAKSCRPGPVWLDIPTDVQRAPIEQNYLSGFNPLKEGFTSSAKIRLKQDARLKTQVAKAIELIKKSKRPVIFAGHGIRLAGGRALFIKTVKQLKIPVLTSMSAHDLINSDHPLFFGRPGVFGDRNGNFTIQNSDLLISIGARLHLWNIGYNHKAFAREAKKIIVDIDKAELKKITIKPDLPIQADANDFMEELVRQSNGIKLPDIGDWLKRCVGWRKRYPVVLPEYKIEKKFVNSYYFIDALSDILDKGEIIVTGDGTAFTCTNQAIKIKKNQRLHYNVGCAAMGYDLPAAIGIYFATKKKRIILITGDGSIMLNIQELQTIFHHKLPIKIFLLNNRCYLAIKNGQDISLGGKYTASDEKSGITFPNFKRIAKSFGISYEKINNNSEVRKKIKKTLRSNKPVICDINMSPGQPLYPSLSWIKRSGGIAIPRPLEDMDPLLNREEFLNNMII